MLIGLRKKQGEQSLKQVKRISIYARRIEGGKSGDR